MTKAELLEIISNGENSGVEFKRDDVRPEKLAKEVVALANLNGGVILLGVEDDGTLSGIQRPKLEEWVMDTIFGRYVHPLIIPYYEEIKLEENKRIGVISFSQGVSKPYVVKNKAREDVYLRIGSTSRLATREQQARLYAMGGMLHTETMPVPGTSMRTLDKVRLENYLSDILQDPDMPSTDEEWLNRLLGLGFLTETTTGSIACTIAGLVLFGVKPRQFLRQAGIRLMAFKGDDKEYQALLDLVLDAPLVGRWLVDGSQRQLIDSGLIEKFIEQITPFIIEEASELDENMRRVPRWLYPYEAVRETVINALAHREWTSFVDIEVASYCDRLEIISPGALRNSMTVEKMIAGQRSTRNQIIVEVLRDYGYVDARGMGVRTKVIPSMKAEGKTPRFEVTEDYVKTTLESAGTQMVYRRTGGFIDEVREKPEQHERAQTTVKKTASVNKDASTPLYAPLKSNIDAWTGRNAAVTHENEALPSFSAPLSGFQRQLIQLILQDNWICYDKLAEITGRNRTTVMRNLQKLKQFGIVARVGSRKTGHWQVIGNWQ